MVGGIIRYESLFIRLSNIFDIFHLSVSIMSMKYQWDSETITRANIKPYTRENDSMT